MVIEAGPEYTFWQLRVPSDEPSFTEPPASPSQSDQQSATAQPDPSWGITSGNTFLVGGGLGRPGSKQRVLAMMRGCGMIMPAKLVEVRSRVEGDYLKHMDCSTAFRRCDC